MSYIGSSYTQQITTPAVDYFNGNGVTTTFQLTRAVTSIFAIQVVVNNVLQNAREAYGITSSNQIVFSSAPSPGINNIYVVYDSQVGQTVTPSPGTVVPSSLSGGGPTWDINGNLRIGGALVSSILENVQTTNYTLALSDQGFVVAMNNASAATVTVPPDSLVLFPVGAVLYICRVGAGTLTLAAGAGVSLSKIGTFAPSEQITIRKRAANTWIIIDSPSTPGATGGSITNAAGYRINSFTAGSGTLTIA
jgi:hypothetical protein